MEEEIITSQEEAAAFLGCSQRTIVRLIQRGEMPEGFLVKKGKKYVKHFWTKKQLEPVKEALDKRKEYYKKV